MRIIRNRLIPFKGFSAINIFGVLFLREGAVIDDTLLRHERIHTLQMRELGFVFFYIFYIVEWLIRLLLPGDAYRNISFEREAYLHQDDPDYLKIRRPYSQWLKTISNEP